MEMKQYLRRVKRKGELLSPCGPPIASLKVPGFDKSDGPHPLLSFLLKVLKGKDNRMIRNHLGFHLGFDFQIRTPEMDDAFEILQKDPNTLEYAETSMIRTMRELADMWIDSGKSRTDQDVDTPADRNVEDVLPRRSESLFSYTYHGLLNSYPRYTGMRRDGTQEVKYDWPRFRSTDLDSGIEIALEKYGRRMAMHYFASLLDSPFSHHINRCDHCKDYFAYRRARLRTVTHGVFCPACEGKGSVKRTENSRAKRLDTAARAWIEWKSRQKGVQLEWVAEQVNKAHGTAFGRRWVSQNLIRILTRVEALRNGKR